MYLVDKFRFYTSTRLFDTLLNTSIFHCYGLQNIASYFCCIYTKKD